MSIEYIKSYYRVPARVGGRVEYTGEKAARYGTITGAQNAYLTINLDGDDHDAAYHPTWELRYLDACASTCNQS
ncbi:hypothetical protein [Brucella intermedia]|uniref:hypothetical protein n=1 Tax=Brucella intermedia TaxID=94625 RepID=UPI0023606505|nr:hypothetical protein [Brucella intermedia]